MGGRGSAKGGTGLGLSTAQKLQQKSLLFALLGLLTKRGRRNARARGRYADTKRYGPPGYTVSLAGLRKKTTRQLKEMYARAARARAKAFGKALSGKRRDKQRATNIWNKSWAIEKILRERGIKTKPFRG